MTPKEYQEKHADEVRGGFKDVENVGLAAGKYVMVVASQLADYKPIDGRTKLPIRDERGEEVTIPMVRVFVFPEGTVPTPETNCLPIRLAQASVAGAMGLTAADEWQNAKDNFTSFRVEKYLYEQRDARDTTSRDKFKYRAY